MRLSRRLGAAGACVCAATMLLGTVARAQAAPVAGWRQFFSQHYGVPGNFSGYEAVVAPGKTNAWAFGGTDLSGGTAPVGTPVAEHWNGRTWRGSALPRGLHDTILAASAASATDVWAVTHFGGYVLHWNGARWSQATQLPGAGQLTGVTALSATDVWVFGGGGFIGGLGTWHFNGRTWRQWKGNASGLETASALSAANIWAIGGVVSPANTIMHFNGVSWRPVTAKALSGLQFVNVRAFSRTNIWASAFNPRSSSPGLLVHFNGVRWTRVIFPWKVDPGRIAADGHGGLWLAAVGSAGPFVVHRTASGRLSRTHVGTFLFDLALIPGTASMWGVGFSGLGATGGNAVIWAYGTIG